MVDGWKDVWWYNWKTHHLHWSRSQRLQIKSDLEVTCNCCKLHLLHYSICSGIDPNFMWTGMWHWQGNRKEKNKKNSSNYFGQWISACSQLGEDYLAGHCPIRAWGAAVVRTAGCEDTDGQMELVQIKRTACYGSAYALLTSSFWCRFSVTQTNG